MPQETAIEDPRRALMIRGAQRSERRASGPPIPQLSPGAHLLEPVISRSERDPGRVVAAYREGPEFVDVSAAELLDRVRALAKGLIASGVRVGDRVAVMSRTRLEWVVLDYAILAVGGITVPIYETSSAAQVAHVLADSEAVLAVLESAEMRRMIDSVKATGTCRETLVIDEGDLDDLVVRGHGSSDGELDARIGALTIDDTATIIYTSGTTGRPKGCVLSHGHLRMNVLQNLDAVSGMLGQDERSLFFLPLAHSYAKMISLVAVEHGIKVAYASGVSNLPEEMAMSEPTMIVGVPRVFEKVFNTAQRRAHDGRLSWMFDRAAEVAIQYSQLRATGSLTRRVRLLHAIYNRLVYRKIREAFGGSLRFAFSGGSALSERLTWFFDGVGVRIFEGYGLTETSPTLTVNRAGAWRPGTVGPPVAATEIRIARDGEVLAAGPQVFAGYWRDDESTYEAFTDDGLFRTGDIGVLEDGFLRIVGRKKDLIVTAGGKNVAPEPMEDRLRAHPLISEAIVVGDDRPFVAALVTLDSEALPSRLATPRRADRASRVLDDPDLRSEVQQAIDAVNASVSSAESIRAFTILATDLSQERGELTPTMKLRRAAIEEAYRIEIDEMYGH